MILRGVNEMFVWGDRTGNALEEISRTGANCIRLVWTLAEGTAQELDALLERCAGLGMLPIAEFHDATGKWEELDAVVSGWLRPDYLAVTKKAPRPTGTEHRKRSRRRGDRFRLRSRVFGCAAPPAPGGNPLSPDDRCRVLGPGLRTSLRTGSALVHLDPLKNVLLSVHMWWPAKNSGGSPESAARRVVDALADAQAKGLPLVVGEFGAAFSEAGEVQEQDRIAWQTILEECHAREIGWLAWSWGGVPNQPQRDLDITRDGRFETLHGWGREVALEHPLSIAHTAKPIEWLRKR
ncbi:MAG: cellulase family glycosylhydrolase [Fibrobacteres bacterium]|nr:cellulase family glycosylhydrolase [Fibrobacterota bacterium]